MFYFLRHGHTQRGMVFRCQMNFIRPLGKRNYRRGIEKSCACCFSHRFESAGQSFAFGKGTRKKI